MRIGQIRLGHRIRRQGLRPFTRRCSTACRTQGGQTQRAVAQRKLRTRHRHLQAQFDAHARPQPVFLAQRARIDWVAVQRINARVRTRQVEGISVGMYSAFTLGVALWLLYGVALGSWPIIMANAVTLTLASAILIMRVRYG